MSVITKKKYSKPYTLQRRQIGSTQFIEETYFRGGGGGGDILINIAAVRVYQ
jgi:hypothetical protein